MAGRIGQPPTDLIDELQDSPESFEFFQAVRLVEQAIRESRHLRDSQPIGNVTGPQSESVRFRAVASKTFPPGEIHQVRLPPAVSVDQPAAKPNTRSGLSIPVEITVPFLGLTGPNGALPDHYTTLLIERAHQRTKDHSLREFFDLFNHRAISLFYLAWKKYRFWSDYEQHLAEGTEGTDAFTISLYSLVGLGLPSLRDRFVFDDQVILYFGGLFANSTRSAVGLQQLLAEDTGLSVILQQFVGQWLYLTADVQSCFPSSSSPDGLNLSLGENAVIGSRAWDVQGRFRVCMGPLNWDEFSSLLPGTTALQALSELIRFYAGIQFDYDIQLILRADDVPSCQLAGTGKHQPLLGMTTWIGRHPERHDAKDAVFRL